MDQLTPEAREQEADPHAGHQMSKAHGNHDRHAGHSVAMFRDKFWLSFALHPVVRISSGTTKLSATTWTAP